MSIRHASRRAEAFLYSEAIDLTTYGRQRELREELKFAQIDHQANSTHRASWRDAGPP